MKNYEVILRLETNLSEIAIKRWFTDRLNIKLTYVKLKEIKENHNY